MPKSVTRIRDVAHFRVSSSVLADWLIDQEEQSWWTVDGDPTLMHRLDFPCPAADLAAVLKQINKTLLVLDTKGLVEQRKLAATHTLSLDELDGVAQQDDFGDRVFQLYWEGGPDVDWALIEDKAVAGVWASKMSSMIEHECPGRPLILMFI